MKTSRGVVVWRYLPKGKVKHALRIDRLNYAGHEPTAVCGTAPSWFAPRSDHWWGTGKQSEYDAVETLPECRRCATLLAPKGEGDG